MVHVTDWFPTFLALAGVPASRTGPRDYPLDGLNVWDTIVSGARVRREFPVNINPLRGGKQFGTPKAAIRVDDMKLLCYWYTIEGIAGGTTTGCHPDERIRHAWPMLFNVTADPLETTNVASRYPELVAVLEARLAQHAVNSVEPMHWEPPYQGDGYECAKCPKHPPGTGDVAVPWEAWLPPRGSQEQLPAEWTVGVNDDFVRLNWEDEFSMVPKTQRPPPSEIPSATTGGETELLREDAPPPLSDVKLVMTSLVAVLAFLVVVYVVRKKRPRALSHSQGSPRHHA
jgi:hypothetical protein